MEDSLVFIRVVYHVQDAASSNVMRKKALLEEEGVKFSGLRVDAASLMAPSALMG